MILDALLGLWCYLFGHRPFHFSDGSKAFAVCERCGRPLRRV